PVARVDGVGAGAAGRLEELAHVEVRLGRHAAAQGERDVGLTDVRQPGVRLGVHGGGPDPHRLTRTEDPRGDLAAVRDQDPGDAAARHRGHIRKTPYDDVPATTAEWQAERAMPSTVRVSRGSTMPSSHS